MRVYINKSEYEALHDAWAYLSELISNGAEGKCKENLHETISGLSSIADKYIYRKVKKTTIQSQP